MKKEIEVTGVNGTYKGFVEIKLNAKNETKKVSNNFIHEDENRNFSYHSVISKYFANEFQNPILFEERCDILNESEVLVISTVFESNLKNKLYFLADNIKTETINDKLKSKGYK